MNYFLLVVVVVVVVLALAYAYGYLPTSFVRGSGKIVSQKIDVRDFSRVSLKGSGDVHIEQGQEEALVIEADDNILPLLDTRVQGNELVLSTKANAHFRPSQPVVYRLAIKDLTALSLLGSGNFSVEAIQSQGMDISLLGSGNIKLKELISSRFSMNITGSGNLEIDRLNTDSVDVNVKGSGEIRLAGRAGSQHVSISGSSRYYSEELETGLAEISIPGSASIKVWVRDELNVKITGSGTVRYFGTPTVTQRVLGSGKVLPQGAK